MYPLQGHFYKLSIQTQYHEQINLSKYLHQFKKTQHLLSFQYFYIKMFKKGIRLTIPMENLQQGERRVIFENPYLYPLKILALNGSYINNLNN